MIPEIMDSSLGFNIYRTGLLFRRELIYALSHYKMTPEQWQVMMILWQAEKPIIQSDIVSMLLKDKYTVSRIIKRLERDKWIKKKSDEKDARVTLLALTKKGSSLKKEIPAILSKHFKKLLKNFNDSEVNSTITSLKKLRTILGDS